MKKFWEINSSLSLDESKRIAFKQMQKFMEKRKVRPVKIILLEEGSIEFRITLEFEDANDTNVVDIKDWINNHRSQNGQRT